MWSLFKSVLGNGAVTACSNGSCLQVRTKWLISVFKAIILSVNQIITILSSCFILKEYFEALNARWVFWHEMTSLRLFCCFNVIQPVHSCFACHWILRGNFYFGNGLNLEQWNMNFISLLTVIMSAVCKRPTGCDILPF